MRPVSSISDAVSSFGVENDGKKEGKEGFSHSSSPPASALSFSLSTRAKPR